MVQSIVMPTAPLVIGLALAVLSLAACGRDPATALAGAAAAAPDSLADHTLIVHEGPHCGCCGLWRQHMEQAGFEIEVRKSLQLGAVKATLAVPPAMSSCHTAEIGGYFIEGHVPAEDVLRLLAEQPSARGLALPGMPIGSPGMEVPGRQAQPFEVLLVARDGSSTVYSRYPREAGSCCSIDMTGGELN